MFVEAEKMFFCGMSYNIWLSWACCDLSLYFHDFFSWFPNIGTLHIVCFVCMPRNPFSGRNCRYLIEQQLQNNILNLIFKNEERRANRKKVGHFFAISCQSTSFLTIFIHTRRLVQNVLDFLTFQGCLRIIHAFLWKTMTTMSCT